MSNRKPFQSIKSPQEDPHLSIIVPTTSDESVLNASYEVIRKQIDASQHRWEIIFVDHGTSELAWMVIQRLLRKDPIHVRAFIFTLNQDRSDALALGYRKARGNLVFTVEVDLNDDPGEISTFLHRIQWDADSARTANRSSDPTWQNILPRGILRKAPGSPRVAA